MDSSNHCSRLLVGGTAAGFIYSGSTAASGGKDTIDMSTVSETSNYEVTIVASISVSGAILRQATSSSAESLHHSAEPPAA